jgi:hypothetical protein
MAGSTVLLSVCAPCLGGGAIGRCAQHTCRLTAQTQCLGSTLQGHRIERRAVFPRQLRRLYRQLMKATDGGKAQQAGINRRNGGSELVGKIHFGTKQYKRKRFLVVFRLKDKIRNSKM